MCRENSRRYDCDNLIRQRYNGVNEIIRCERAYSVLIRRIGLLFFPPFIQQKRKKEKETVGGLDIAGQLKVPISSPL